MRSDFDHRVYAVSTILKRPSVPVEITRQEYVDIPTLYQSAIFQRRRLVSILAAPELTISLANFDFPQVTEDQFHALVCQVIKEEGVESARSEMVYQRYGYEALRQDLPSFYLKKIRHIFIYHLIPEGRSAFPLSWPHAEEEIHR